MSAVAFKTVQFSQSSHSVQQRIYGVSISGQIVHHLVAMIRSHRDQSPSALMKTVNSGHYSRHRRIALDVVCFMKGTVRLPLYEAKTEKANPVAASLQHARQVVVVTYSKKRTLGTCISWLMVSEPELTVRLHLRPCS